MRDMLNSYKFAEKRSVSAAFLIGTLLFIVFAFFIPLVLFPETISITNGAKVEFRKYMQIVTFAMAFILAVPMWYSAITRCIRYQCWK